MKTKRDSRLLIVITSLLFSLLPTFAQAPPTDLLIYKDDESSHFMSYNPETGDVRQLPIQGELWSISITDDGRIAYIHDNDIWVLNVLDNADTSINITQTPNEQEMSINWTPDGRLLHYLVVSDSSPDILYIYDGERTLAIDSGYNMKRSWNKNGWFVTFNGDHIDDLNWSVWNGKESVNLELPLLSSEPIWQTFEWLPNNHLFITIGYTKQNLQPTGAIDFFYWNGEESIKLEFPLLPSEPIWQSFKWTPNNHLFITIGYQEQEYMEPIGATDIFYWNGQDIHKVDNPSDSETFMLRDFSADGRLTLYTQDTRGDFVGQWYIWDGKSFTSDNIPDTSTLIEINSRNERISVAWMPDGRLAIVSICNPESEFLLGHAFSCSEAHISQVYIWDEEGLIQVTSNDLMGLLVDVHDNGHIAVSNFDGLRIFGVTVFDSNLQIVFQSKGYPSRHSWSSDGNLAYCNGTGLFVWDGQGTVQLNGYDYAEWLFADSPSMTCSVG